MREKTEEKEDAKYYPHSVIKSTKENMCLLRSGVCMPSKPFNLPNCPGETEAHTGHVSCSKTIVPQSGRTGT